ncbi:hypothetical protein KIW84_054688 [Lathyrus oleraceus]|uniref:Uncharacterized protein n=1 Tax=Pisum sativum TaxID=3888 RepID=A0A9D5AIT1_PEA|nr:hypothetical protein KIW84_054688 [Pisum sativum]
MCTCSIAGHNNRQHSSSGIACPSETIGVDLQNIWHIQQVRVQTHQIHFHKPETYGNSPLPLAAERTRRKDPLHGFNEYTNGWNISDHHYWASVAYTAVSVFSIAAIWFLGFGFCLLLLIVCYFCRKSEPYGSFHRGTTSTSQYVVYQADSTVDKLRNVSDFLAQAKQVGIDRVFLPVNVQTDIDEAETDINASAATISDKTKENSDNIQDLLESMRMTLIIIAAVMLVLTFLGFLFSIFGMQVLVYILVIAGWFLVTGTLILCGLFLILHNATAEPSAIKPCE